MAEKHIQTIKKMIKMILDDKKDIDLALLRYRNTPILGSLSPAEILMSRKLRDTLPKPTNRYEPRNRYTGERIKNTN